MLTAIKFTLQGARPTYDTEASEHYKKFSGIKPGDLITEVDGVSVVNADDTTRTGIRGEPGTVVVLTIKRGDQILKFSVTRRT